MSKQRPDPDKLANELSGASAFFRPATPLPMPSPAPTAEPERPPNPEKRADYDVVTSQRQSVMTSHSTASPSGFDINRPTASRDSLRLSVDETKALDELRAALKWDYDIAVSKNDICRAALHWFLEDFHSKADKSAAVSRLKRKQTAR